MKTSTFLSAALVSGIAWGAAGAAHAAVLLPNGDNFLNGVFEFTWGTDGSGRIDPAFYVGGNTDFPTGLDAVFVPVTDVTAAAGLEFDYAISGVGTDATHITYRVTNNTATDWHNLRFIGDVSGDPFDPEMELVTLGGAGGGAGDPARFGVDDFFTGDLFLNDILNSGLLDNGNHCAGGCSAEGALQWDVVTLGQGEIWKIDILLSELAATQSLRWLDFQLTDAGGTVLVPSQMLTFSGTASVVPVPLPAGLLLFGAGLAALGLVPQARRGVS